MGWRYKSVLNVTRVAVVAWLTEQGNWFCLVWAVVAAKSPDIWTFIDGHHSTAPAITDMTGGMLPTASDRKPFVPLPSTAGHRRTCPDSSKNSTGPKHLPRTSIWRPWYRGDGGDPCCSSGYLAVFTASLILMRCCCQCCCRCLYCSERNMLLGTYKHTVQYLFFI